MKAFRADPRKSLKPKPIYNNINYCMILDKFYCLRRLPRFPSSCASSSPSVRRASFHAFFISIVSTTTVSSTAQSQNAYATYLKDIASIPDIDAPTGSQVHPREFRASIEDGEHVLVCVVSHQTH